MLTMSAGALISALSTPAMAADACVPAPAKLPAPALGSFHENPSRLLDRNSSGGPALSAEVRRLATSDLSTVSKLIALAKDAKPEHVVALGIGLAHAAATCTENNSQLAETIKKLVAESGNVALTASFGAESSLFAYAPNSPSLQACNKLGMGVPPDMTPTPLTDAEPVTPPSIIEEQSTADKLGIGQPGFLPPYTFGKEVETADLRRKLPSLLGDGGVVATSGNVVSPAR